MARGEEEILEMLLGVEPGEYSLEDMRTFYFNEEDNMEEFDYGEC